MSVSPNRSTNDPGYNKFDWGISLVCFEDLPGQQYRSDGRDSIGWFVQSNQDRFHALAQLTGDTSFGRPVTYCYSAPVFIDTVAAIHVFSNPGLLDDSNSHIDSLFEVRYDLPHLFVNAGYKNEVQIKQDQSLNEFNQSPKVFMSSIFSLILKNDIAYPDTANFIVQISFTNGKVFDLKYESVVLQ